MDAMIYVFPFTVPLDYSYPTAEDSSVISMRMLPATVPDSEQLGTIFTNPGAHYHTMIYKTNF
jgi:hypothetical protein